MSWYIDLKLMQMNKLSISSIFSDWGITKFSTLPTLCNTGKDSAEQSVRIAVLENTLQELQ